MKKREKMKTKINGVQSSESNSLSQSQNDEFKDSLPPSTFDSQRFTTSAAKEEDESKNGVEEREDFAEDEDDNVEYDDYEEEEDYYEEDDYEEEELEEREKDGNNGENRAPTMEPKKLAEGFYEVEFIRRKRICKGERQYLIKWRGWPENANTWEPVEHLQTCPDVVEAFEESLRSGQKKSSRKRKRKFTQPKKKMQYSYGVSKKHDEAKKRPRRAKSIDCKSSETVSPHVASNEKENGGQLFVQNSSGKDLVVHDQQPLAVEGDCPANCQSNANCVEAGQSNQRRGAKRRKSGSVRRFTQDMTSLSIDYFANAAPMNISSCDRAEEVMLGNCDAYRKKKIEGSRSSNVITRLIKPISYSASVTNNVQDVTVTFVAMRSDGKEVMVDNKFLKANNPHLLINFYEQHLRYNPN